MGLRESAIRVRIERILSGSKDPHEIAQIFADVRFLGCPQEVRDLADFSAHRPEKDRGRLLEKTSKLFQQLRLHLQGRSSLHVEAAYTDEQVANALSSFCVAVAIFQPSELTDISRLKMMIALYGLASIHGCVFQEMDGSKQTPLTIRNSAGRLENRLYRTNCAARGCSPAGFMEVADTHEAVPPPGPSREEFSGSC